MSIKRDPSGRRSIQAEAEVPGTPEEVWEAIATGPGIGSWFYTTDVRGTRRRRLRYHTGSEMDHIPAKVTAWDPPRRFRHEGKDCGPDGPPTATEWTIEPRAGGRCLVRVVHSLFASTDDWDDQLENFEAGWPQALVILRLYLTHFRDRRASILRAYGAFDGSVDEAWTALLAALDACGLGEGDPWTVSAPDAASLAGALAEVHANSRQPTVFFRTTEPVPGIAAACAYKIAERATVVLSVYFYGDGAPSATASAESAWQAWMKARFP